MLVQLPPDDRRTFAPNGLFGPSHDLDVDRAVAIGGLLGEAIGGADPGLLLGDLLAETAADATAVIINWLSTAPGPDGKPLSEAEIEPLRAAGFAEWLPPRPDEPAAVVDARNALTAVRGFLQASDERDTARALPLLFVAGQFHERMKLRRYEADARLGQRIAPGQANVANVNRQNAVQAASRRREVKAYYHALLKQGRSDGLALSETATKFGRSERTIQRDLKRVD